MKKISVGMVGGGEHAFIGNVHRIALRMDGRYELSAACLSSQPERALRSALQLGISAERSYAHYQVMAESERRRADGIRAVIIVTPNHLHYPVALSFLEAGIHVICDKPLCVNSEQAQHLNQVAQEAGCILAVTYNYCAYPMVREARQKIANGELGKLRTLQVEYSQDWLADDLEASGQKQASWRTDPSQAGAAGCLGDIGVHAYNLVRFVSGLSAHQVAADVTSFVEGRRLDDYAQVMLRFDYGARGTLLASQISRGKENHLRFYISGELGSLEWNQEQPDQLIWAQKDQASRILKRARSGVSSASADVSYLPAGHPEGYLEAFSMLYKEIADVLLDVRAHDSIQDAMSAAHDLSFIEACLKSAQRDSAWVKLA